MEHGTLSVWREIAGKKENNNTIIHIRRSWFICGMTAVSSGRTNHKYSFEIRVCKMIAIRFSKINMQNGIKRKETNKRYRRAMRCVAFGNEYKSMRNYKKSQERMKGTKQKYEIEINNIIEHWTLTFIHCKMLWTVNGHYMELLFVNTVLSSEEGESVIYLHNSYEILLASI